MKYCSHCNQPNEDDAHFCVFCGSALEGAQDTSPVPENNAPMPENTPFSVPVLVENDTPMNKETLQKFYTSILHSGVIFLVAGAVLLACGIYELLAADGEIFLVCGIIILACGIVLTVMYFTVYTNDKRFSPAAHQVHRFDEQGMTAIFMDGAQKTGETFLSYDKFSKVTLQNKFIVLRCGVSAYILDPARFTAGDYGTLKALLLAKCQPGVVKLK